MNTKLFISLLGIPYFNHKTILQSLDPYVDGFHIDVMDDHFVDNLAFSPNMIHLIAEYTKKQLWLHLMVDNPKKWLKRTYLLKPEDRITIHCEILNTMPYSKQIELLHNFKEYKLDVGVAINPVTPNNACFDLLPHIDHLLIMTVNPGFSGQSFMEPMKNRIREFVKIKNNKNYSYRVSVDGGITKSLYDELKKYAVNDFVIGSSVLSSTDRDAIITFHLFKK